jgi:hypothetical protein
MLDFRVGKAAQGKVRIPAELRLYAIATGPLPQPVMEKLAGALVRAKTKEPEKLGAFAKPAFHHIEIAQHIAQHSSDRARAKVVRFVEMLHPGEDFLPAQAVILERAELFAMFAD